jgi:uncharacterized protein
MTRSGKLKSILISAALAVVCASSSARAADYAPMDCEKASKPAEKTICAAYSLGQREARVATMYGILSSLVAMGSRSNLGEAQIAWIKKRDECQTDVGCIEAAYSERIKQLSAAFDTIAARGPF